MRNKHLLYVLSKITVWVGPLKGSKGSADVTGT